MMTIYTTNYDTLEGVFISFACIDGLELLFCFLGINDSFDLSGVASFEEFLYACFMADPLELLKVDPNAVVFTSVELLSIAVWSKLPLREATVGSCKREWITWSDFGIGTLFGSGDEGMDADKVKFHFFSSDLGFGTHFPCFWLSVGASKWGDIWLIFFTYLYIFSHLCYMYS